MTTGARAAAFVAALVAVATIAGCSDDKPKRAASASSASDTTTSAPPSTTTSTTASTTTTARPSCTAGPRPPTAIRVSEAGGDFDGDGTRDTLAVYGTGNDATPAPYIARVELGGGRGAVETPIVDAATDPNQNVKALGASEISARTGAAPDGSGAEAFVAVGSGASTSLVGIYELEGCELVRLVLGGSPSTFPVGATVTHFSGLRCDAASGGSRLVQGSAESMDGVTYATSEQAFDVKDGQLVPAGPAVAGSLSVDDPQLSRFSGLDCPGVEPL